MKAPEEDSAERFGFKDPTSHVQDRMATYDGVTARGLTIMKP